MKSLKFFVTSILLGFGLMITPLSGSAIGNVIIPVPEAEANGDFKLDNIQGMSLPSGVSNVRFQRFFKNGYVEGPDDLCIVTYEYEGETHIVQFKFIELCEKGYIDCSGGKKPSIKVFRLM